MLGATHLFGFGAGGEVQTAWTAALTTDSSNAGYSFRVVAIAPTVAGSFVRVTFTAPAAGTLTVDHASIGIRSANADTASTPVELKFASASGFTIANGATITSDFVLLPITTAQRPVIIFDVNAVTGATRFGATAQGDTYFKAASASYATAAVSGYTLDSSEVWNATKLEVLP